MGCVNKSFKKRSANFFIEAGQNRPELGKGSEVLEFTGAEEFDVPIVDARIGKSSFLVSAEVEFDVLGDSSLEFLFTRRGGAFHPGFH